MDLTRSRRTLQAAVEPLLREGETAHVNVGPSEYERKLTKQDFTVTITVGEAGDEALNERLDELLSGPVKAALEQSTLRPTVTKTSGYQALPPDRLGATWTAQIID